MLYSSVREGLQRFLEVLIRHSGSACEPFQPDEVFRLVVDHRIHWIFDHVKSPLLSCKVFSVNRVSVRKLDGTLLEELSYWCLVISQMNRLVDVPRNCS